MFDTREIHLYFSKLGLSSEIADIYLALHAHGPQTLSELSRNAGVERTRLYRLLDDLQANNLIEIEMQYKKRIVSAAPVANLQILITKKEQDLHDLRLGLRDLQEQLAHHSLQSAATKIQAYQGLEGLKQMYWNQTRSHTENVSILYENIQTRTNVVFFERWAHICNERKMKFRSVVSDNFLRSQQTWYEKHNNERLKDWQGQYVPKEVFPITHSTVIYNDVVSYFNWKDNDVFGIEIYNQEIADSQRQFFEMLWSQSVPFKDQKLDNG